VINTVTINSVAYPTSAPTAAGQALVSSSTSAAIWQGIDPAVYSTSSGTVTSITVPVSLNTIAVASSNISYLVTKAVGKTGTSGTTVSAVYEIRSAFYNNGGTVIQIQSQTTFSFSNLSPAIPVANIPAHTINGTNINVTVLSNATSNTTSWYVSTATVTN